MSEPTIVTDWDSMPPEVYAEGEVYSTRVLADNYRKMQQELEALKQKHKRDMDAKTKEFCKLISMNTAEADKELAELKQKHKRDMDNQLWHFEESYKHMFWYRKGEYIIVIYGDIYRDCFTPTLTDRDVISHLRYNVVDLVQDEIPNAKINQEGET